MPLSSYWRAVGSCYLCVQHDCNGENHGTAPFSLDGIAVTLITKTAATNTASVARSGGVLGSMTARVSSRVASKSVTHHVDTNASADAKQHQQIVE